MGQETTRLGEDGNVINATAQDATTSGDPDEIEQEIERTRSEMSGTIDAIQERLSPEALKAQAKEAAHDATVGRVVDAKDQAVEKVQELASQATDKVRGLTGGKGDGNDTTSGTSSNVTSTARDAGSTVIEAIRANPIPAAIAGAGLGMFLTRRSDNDHGRSTYMRDTPTYRADDHGQQMNYRTGYTNWDRNQPEPGHLRQYEGDTFMSQVSSTGSDVVGMIQRNPVPAALAGVGIGWFLMRRGSGSERGDQPYYYRPGQHTTHTGDYGYRGGQREWQQNYDTQGYGYQSSGAQGSGQQGSDSDQGRVGEVAGTVQETAGDVMQRAQEMGSQAVDRVSQFGSLAQDQMSGLPQQAQQQVQNLRGTYQQKMQESPLMMGIVAMGLGLAVGMLLPETEKENQVFGEKRDELMDRAQDMAGQAVERAQEVAQEAVQAAQETVKESTQSASTSQSSSTTA